MVREYFLILIFAALSSADHNQLIKDYNPLSALINCSFVPEEFLDCQAPLDLKENTSIRADLGYGCAKFGNVYYHEVEKTKVPCTVYEGIECHGDRNVWKYNVPCVRYSDHYFLTTLLYSILLGFLGMDRFSLGQTGTAVGKLLTLGGVGIWWVIDIILLVTNILRPEDQNWNPRI